MIIIKIQTDDKILECNCVNQKGNKIMGVRPGRSGDHWLGHYKSEERAKEVMEEIHGHIVDCYNSRYWMERYPSDHKFDVVFQMPKE